MPKETAQAAVEFYQSEYAQGFTTDCPSDEELANLLAKKFKGSQKDYGEYLAVLAAAGLQPGDTIIDYGCSWGYGSWQLREAGFRVLSSEVSLPRARYAEEKLKCDLITNVDDLPSPVDCFFSAHVIEHLPDPNAIWKQASRVLRDGGLFVSFAPNGDPSLERKSPDIYHKHWGKVHPLMWTPQALSEVSRRYGFTPTVFSSPYQPENIRLSQEPKFFEGEELLLIAVLRKSQ